MAQQGATEFLETYERLLDIIGTGYQREGKRYATIAVGCTGGKHRSVAMAEELAAPAEDPRHRHRRRPPRPGARMSSPVPDAFSDAPAVVALGGGHGLAASLQALRRVVRPADRRGHGRRRRRLQRPAAPRARRAAARRPADGAGRAVRRRRVGPDLERRRAAPLPQRGRAARALRRQPADRRAVGAAGRLGVRARLGRAAARRAGPGAADVRRTAGHRGARRDARATSSSGSAARSRSPPPPAGCAASRCCRTRRRPARRPCRRCSTPTGWCSGPARGSPA